MSTPAVSVTDGVLLVDSCSCLSSCLYAPSARTREEPVLCKLQFQLRPTSTSSSTQAGVRMQAVAA